MPSSIGIQLGQNKLISGFGRHHTHRRTHHAIHGSGITRKVIGKIAGIAAHAVANKIESAITGGSYKLAGTGRKKRVYKKRAPRTTLSFGTGHKRRVGRPRKPRTTLSFGTGHRRHRAPHRLVMF